MRRLLICATLFLAPHLLAAPATTQSLDGYATVAQAIRAKVTPALAASNDAPQAPYLGVALVHSSTAAQVELVAADSPAARAGLRAGDEIARLDGQPVTAASFEGQLRAYQAGDDVSLTLRRDGTEISTAVTLGTPSKPLHVSERRVLIGVVIKDASEAAGALIDRVMPDMPAARAGIRPGDLLVDVDGVPVSSQLSLNDFLQSHTPDETVTTKVVRAGKALTMKVTLAGETTRQQLERALDPTRFVRQNVWTKPAYHLAIVGIEFPDVKRNAKITNADWEECFFSTGTYDHKKSVTGQDVHGSLNDFYREQSYGKFHVEGRAFDWVAASKPRADYGRGTGDSAGLLPEALDRLLEREGKDALANFDGIFFVYAGTRVQTSRGGLYWPHKGYATHKGKRWPFVIVPEGGAENMTNLSLCGHEFGHMLGLPDLYARPENPGSEGLGVWCLMSNQLGNGRPQHMSAWCKEQLGWIRPAVLDPRVKQRLLLSPIEDSPDECYKVLLRDDGSEYFLLENRQKAKFDGDLPAGGLLIWRVNRGHVTLEESHGVDGPLGPRSFLLSVPFPSASNNAFTPYTIPSSRSQMGGGAHDVYITDVRRLGDGRIAFAIGYEVM